MTEDLEASGIDPDATPTDRLPEVSAWALVAYYNDMNEVNNDE